LVKVLYAASFIFTLHPVFGMYCDVRLPDYQKISIVFLINPDDVFKISQDFFKRNIEFFCYIRNFTQPALIYMKC